MDQTLSPKAARKAESKFFDKVSTLGKRALQSKAEWNDKDEFLDVIYWMRQIIGVILGVLWGLFAFKGMFAILSFAAINAFLVYGYTVSFQKIDEDEFGGLWDIIKEGFMTSFSTFLICWIVVYSALL